MLCSPCFVFVSGFESQQDEIDYLQRRRKEEKANKVAKAEKRHQDAEERYLPVARDRVRPTNSRSTVLHCKYSGISPSRVFLTGGV